MLIALAFLVADAVVGGAAPAFTLTDTHGKQISLADYKGKIVVLEWFNPNCPFVKRHYADNTMTSTYGKHNNEIAWFAITSTAKSHKEFLSADALNKWADEHSVKAPLLVDADGKVGKAYGAKTTPHMFVIDREGKVAYAGAIDDDPTGKLEASKRKNYVDQAINALKTGGKVPDASTKSYGCGVKYAT